MVAIKLVNFGRHTYLLAFAALPSFAAAEFQIPESCEPLVAVQQQGCSLSKVWSCDEGDNKGNYWVSEISSYAVGETDAAIQQLDQDGRVLRHIRTSQDLEEEPILAWSDPFSISDLLEHGRDAERSAITHDYEDWYSFHNKWTLAGTQETHDGVVFETLDASWKTFGPDGSVIASFEGQALYSPRIKAILTQTSWQTTRKNNVIDTSIVDIIWPGEEGFDATTPLYGCED